LSNTT